MTADSSPQYWLMPHIYLCKRSQHVVLIDIKRNQYIGLSARDAPSLVGWIHGWPATYAPTSAPIANTLGKSSWQSESDTASSDTTHLVEQMLRDGMLTRDSHIGKVGEPTTTDRPESALIDGYGKVATELRLRDAMSLLLAVFTTNSLWWPRKHSIERITARFHHRRMRIVRKPRSESRGEEFDTDMARAQVALFERVRPFLYTAQNACLFDSVLLAEFLAWSHLYPKCVLGVSTDPFRAHCWLQHGGLVLNDTPENVRKYTPILVL